MADATAFNSFITYTARVMRGELSPPSSFRMLLCTGGSIDRTSSMSAIAGAEITSSGGYTRQTVDFAGAGTVSYNSTDNRANIPAVSLTVSASGASISYDTVVVVADATGTIGNTTGQPVFFIETTPQSIGAGTSQTITLSGFGFANIGSADGV